MQILCNIIVSYLHTVTVPEIQFPLAGRRALAKSSEAPSQAALIPIKHVHEILTNEETENFMQEY